jgi:hypothetical protein
MKNENICNNNGGFQGKKEDRKKISLPPKSMVFLISSRVEC